MGVGARDQPIPIGSHDRKCLAEVAGVNGQRANG